ncbi:MAG: hypothetical protein H7A46_15030 [Verrucomicrobiales bacterium]|nr:hypothetical protein [Verrucomicrobiales bacterium]
MLQSAARRLILEGMEDREMTVK